MNKYLLLLIAPLLSFILLGCNKEDDVKPMDLNLFDGLWEVTGQGEQDIFSRGCILDISTDTQSNYEGSTGIISTFYLTATGIKFYDKVYNWNIREVSNNIPLLDVVLQGELDGDDLLKRNYYYKIIKLNATHMWWQVRSDGDDSIIMFKRRTDIQPNNSF